MVLTSSQPLYCGHLRDNEELYVKDSSLVVIDDDKKNVFTVNLDVIRCAFPVSRDTVRIFWRAPKSKEGEQGRYHGRYHQDFRLDLGRSFPDRTQRRKAGRTESKRLANLLLVAVQKNHPKNRPNMEGYLAMHAGEHLMSRHDGECRFGKGQMLITNLGIYFVTFDRGLCLEMPLDILDSYDSRGRTVRIHYFEPTWRDGYDESSRRNRGIEIRVKSEPAESVCTSIAKAYSDGGAKEIRTLATYTEEFGSMTPEEIYAQYYSGKYGTFKRINDYLAILAKRRWGSPTTKEIGECDARVVLACLCTGIPLEVAGDLTRRDRKIREDILRYGRRFEQYNMEHQSLLAEAMKIVTENLQEEDSQRVRDGCNPYIIFDTIQEIARNGSVPESFRPQSLVEWQQFKKEINEKITVQELDDLPDGFSFAWTDEIFCPWGADEAKRIASEKDYSLILAAIASLDAAYEDIEKFQSGPMYAKTFEREQRQEAKLRARRVYDTWCKSNPPSQWTDHTDRGWVQHVIEGLDEGRLELRREHFGSQKTAIDEIRDAEMESQNTKTRLERAIKPKGIPEEDTYADAWHDQSRHMWFTTNPYFRISEAGLEVMGPDKCELKFGYRATVFSEDAVGIRHGYPAVYNEKRGWWVLLCTISDENITKEMADEKRTHRTLRYETVEPDLVITNAGTLGYATEKEFVLQTEGDSFWGSPLPLNERIRRLLFAETASYDVAITKKEHL